MQEAARENKNETKKLKKKKNDNKDRGGPW
jgi:hypothetical protein